MKAMKKENIYFREAVLADCYDLAVLKGKVWNTTYQGIYPQEKLTGYNVEKNQKNRKHWMCWMRIWSRRKVS